jgi:hypothetical protein
LEDAVAASVAVYEAILARLASDLGLEVFVHPVPPVLDTTRRVVANFNAALRRRVRRLRALQAAVGSGSGAEAGEWRRRVHWLEFAEDLLAAPGPGCPNSTPACHAKAEHPAGGGAGGDGGAGLRPEFGLDGTHLSPTYLPLLQRALDAAAAAAEP